MTTDELVRSLLEEIRTDRETAKAERRERKEQFDRIEARLTVVEGRIENCTVAILECRSVVDEVRRLAFEGDDNIRRQIRLVSDYAGMTDPREGNGGK